MLEKLRKMLTDAGIDPAVGSIDYWQNELEGVLLNMYDQGVAAEREACADLVFKMCNLPEHKNVWIPLHDAQLAIRARGEPSPAFKNFIDDKWAGIL